MAIYRQGVDSMISRRVRATSLLVLLVSALGLSGLLAPSASAEVGIHITFMTQPAHAEVGALITGEAFDPTGADGSRFVQVRVRETVLVPDPDNEGEFIEETHDVQNAQVSFELGSGAGLANPTGALHVISRFTNADGVATFEPQCDFESETCDNPLWIGVANNPFTTDYKLRPLVTIGDSTHSGPLSDGFDVWGDVCTTKDCPVNLSPGVASSDTYTNSEDVVLAASKVAPQGTRLSCAGQQVVFSSDIFFHMTTGAQAVFLETHIDRRDMKFKTNNGLKFIGWCVGLKNAGPWNFPRKDTNGDGHIDTGSWVPGSDLWVGMAPKCPKTNQSDFAPCYTIKTPDNIGGAFIRGWLPGEDPPRRT